MRVIVTRPLEDGEATAALLHAMGHEAIVAPLLGAHFHDGQPLHLDGVQGLLFTSANGARALARRTSLRDFPVFAVGTQTAQAARDAGFADVRNADGDAAHLAAIVRQSAKPQDGPLLHASGAEAEGRLARSLAEAGFTVRTEILYDVPLAAELPHAARGALAQGTADAVLLYSTRSAQAFADLVAKAGLDAALPRLIACCISEAAARPLRALPFRAIRIAARPNQAALLDCLG